MYRKNFVINRIEKMIKIIILSLIMSFSLNITYAQSIGATNTPTITDFWVSQGSDYPEKITIESSYDWLSIEETEFILESKSGKTINLNITVKKPGNYVAALKICATPISKEGAALSTKACTHHNLTVNATLDNKTKTLIIVSSSATLLILSLCLCYILKGRKRSH
jgi:hypothetical protein